MVNIAMIEDDQKTAEEIRRLIADYANEYDMQIDLKQFSVQSTFFA